jgi:hypothetical protein
MDPMLRRVLQTIFAIFIVSACGNFALAVPTCPTLCLLPPDPAPPLPPMPVDDPPLRPLLSQSTVNNSNPVKATANTAPATRAMISGKLEEGGECGAGKMSGTLVKDASKFTCNFKPSSLKVGAACHALKKIGTVTVIEGKRYCQVAP